MTIDVAEGPGWTLYCGAWQDTPLADARVDALIADPPYSARTHEGHDDGASLANRAGQKIARSDGGHDVARVRQAISYSHWTPGDVQAFVLEWEPRTRGWLVCMSDSDLCAAYRASFEATGRTGFQPLPCVIPGMTVRMSGDGPSSWAVYANVARTKAMVKCGTKPGAYIGNQGEREHIGGKPLWLMRALVRDYSEPGDLVCDPTAGGATTLLASVIEGRRAIGAERDPETWRKAVARLRRGYTPSFDWGSP